MKKILISVLALAGMNTGAMAQMNTFQEGVHYFLVDQAPVVNADGTVQVTEAFSYLCNHCKTFEPFMQNWLGKKPENVSFNRIPVVFGRDTWGLYATGYVTAAEMGIADEAHVAMMEKIWTKQDPARNLEQLAEFYSGFGVDKDTYLETAESFSVDMRLRNEQKLVRQYGVSGTPTMIVNGKYRVEPGQAVGTFDMMLAVVDYLVAMEQVAVTKEAAPANEAVEDTLTSE
jgi:thiol:disulfide interchange protein DsbA